MIVTCCNVRVMDDETVALEQKSYYPRSYYNTVHRCLQNEQAQYWLHTKHSREWGWNINGCL